MRFYFSEIPYDIAQYTLRSTTNLVTLKKVSSEKKDDNLGTNVVQFTDKLAQVYILGKMNFKRY